MLMTGRLPQTIVYELMTAEIYCLVRTQLCTKSHSIFLMFYIRPFYEFVVMQRQRWYVNIADNCIRYVHLACTSQPAVEMFLVLHLSTNSKPRHSASLTPYSQMPVDWEFILGLIAAGTKYKRQRLDKGIDYFWSVLDKYHTRL